MKLIKALPVIALSLLLTSCSKEYTCVCTGDKPGDNHEYTLKSVSRVTASNRCEKNNASADNPGGLHCEIQ